MPEECIREIILRVNDHRDLEASSAAWTLMAALASEQRVWRELTQFHFTKHQIEQIIQKQFNKNDDNTNNNSKLINGNNNLNEVDLVAFHSIEGKTSSCAGNTKDWQKIYHALRRYILKKTNKNINITLSPCILLSAFQFTYLICVVPFDQRRKSETFTFYL